MTRFATVAGEGWVPDPQRVAGSHIARIMRTLDVPDIEALHEFALRQPARYYAALIEHLDIRFQQPFDDFVDLEKGAAFPRWFPGGRLNIVDSCLRTGTARDAIDAVRVIDEDGQVLQISYDRLRAEAGYLAANLHTIGIARGDCVGLFMPMGIEATVAFFACAWVGAIAVPAFSGYAAEALRVRLQDCDARLLITAAGFRRRGSWIDMAKIAAQASAGLPVLERVICVGEGRGSETEGPRWETWETALAKGAQEPALAPQSMDPNDPLLVMYTSGTTGRPKGIVHSHAGFLVKVASDFAIAFDLRDDDRFCWITDLGWLVGPQMIVGNAAMGATAIYYVGAIDTPDSEQIWRICAQEHVSILGVSPSAVRAMAAANEDGPNQRHDLSALRAFVSTGEPWDSTSWQWLFSKVGQRRLPILNYSGGTEIAGGILTSYATLPLAACAFAGPVIGMDADVVAADGQPAEGAVGELVVRNIWPGMTHSFWGGNDELYLKTYWSDFPGVWRHGDLAQRDADGWWFIRGRSDDTLKVAGRRVGPAEIEAVLLQNENVLEAVVVGVPDAMRGQSIVAFVVGVGRQSVAPDILKAEVRERLGASLVPSIIHIVEALPKTRNGKVVRRAIVARYLGQTMDDLSVLDNGEALLGIPQVAT